MTAPTIVRHRPSTFAEAIAPLGLTPADVLAAIPICEGTPYLTGSLAVGLGDKRSDVDIQIVASTETVDSSPALSFTPDGQCVDVRHVHPSTIVNVVDPQRADSTISGRTVSWQASRWLNSMPLDPLAPPLLSESQRAQAVDLIIRSLRSDVVALTAFALLAEDGDNNAGWHLARRAGIAAWELAATLAGEHYLGERWLPARSSDPGVAAVAETALAIWRPADLQPLLEQLGIDFSAATANVKLTLSPEVERWSLAGQDMYLLSCRSLLPASAEPPASIAEAITNKAPNIIEAINSGVLRYQVLSNNYDLNGESV